MARKVSRRALLRWAGLVAGTAVAGACTPEIVVETVVKEVEKVVKETVIIEGEEKVIEKVVKETVIVEKEAEEPTGFQGEIELYAQAYTPTSVQVNPDPSAPKRVFLEYLTKAWSDTHPGVELKCITGPSGDYYDWLDTQLLGGVGPDMFWLQPGFGDNYVDKGMLVPLNDYLEMPNPYTDDPRPWKEWFLSPFADRFRSIKGLYFAIPQNMVSTGMFCNVDMLAEIGVDLGTDIDPELGSPDSWATWMGWLAALQEADYIPCSPGALGVNDWWIWGVLDEQICWPWIEQMDGLNYHEEMRLEFQEGNVSQEELNHAYWCHDFRPFESDEVAEMYRIVEDWTQYFPDGWVSPDMESQWELFAMGELGMVWDGSWRIGSLLADDRREFEFSSFWLPPVTEETSSFVHDPLNLPIGVGNMNFSYAINHKCIQKGCVDECVDFLMMLSTPENNAGLVNEIAGFIPVVKGAPALPQVENIYIGETRLVPGVGHPLQQPMGYFGVGDIKWKDMIQRENQLFFLGEQTMEETFSNLAETAVATTADLLRRVAIQYTEAGSWDLTQWDCEPQI